MLIFVVGLSQFGKTTLAKALADRFGIEAVSASEWVRSRFVPERSLSKQEYTEAITVYAQVELAKNPDACVDFIRSRHDVNNRDYVVEGVRNPRDFALLFRPDRDVALFVSFDRSELRPTAFEWEGVETIRQFVDWHIVTGILPVSRRLDYALDAIVGQRLPEDRRSEICGPPRAVRCWNVDELIARAGAALADLARPITKAFVHSAIDPVQIWVEERVLFNEDPEKTAWVPARAFAVSSYAGHALTFEVLLDNGSVFSYVPPHRVRWSERTWGTTQFDLFDLVYANAPSEKLAVHRYDTLAESLPRAYFAKRDLWLDAIYLFTIDWYADNLLLHALKLENGQIAFLPSHKVLFHASAEDGANVQADVLPPYQKLRAEFRIEKGDPDR